MSNLRARPDAGKPVVAEAIGSIDEIYSVASISNPVRRETDNPFARGEALCVRGWISASDPDATTSKIGMVVDDLYEVEVASGIARPDVAAALTDPRLLPSGFMAALTTHDLAVGDHVLSFFCWDDRSTVRHDLQSHARITIAEPGRLVPEREECAEGRVVGHIDEISVDVIEGRGGNALSIFARGWACDVEKQAPCAEVFGVATDGSTARAVIGFARPDVAGALGNPAFASCGFRLRLFTRAATFDLGELRVTAVTADRMQRSSFWAVS
jgi:hypothetical protein